MNCCICGPIKNCGPYLKKVFENIEKIGSLFDSYQIVVFYDKSNDNTLEILNDYYSKNSITHLKQILNISSYLFDSDWDDNLYEMMHRRGSLINLCLKRILFNENLDIIQLDKILIWETKFF